MLLMIGGILAFEGALWAIVPSLTRRMYEDAFALGDRVLHITGLISVALGVACIALAIR